MPRLGGAYCFRRVRSQQKSVDCGTMGPALGGAYECYAHIASFHQCRPSFHLLVFSSVHSFIRLFILPPFLHPSIPSSVRSVFRPFILPTVPSSVCSSIIHFFIHPSVCLSVFSSVWPISAIRSFIHPFLWPFIHPLFRLILYSSINSFVFLPPADRPRKTRKLPVKRRRKVQIKNTA